jgi:hypothetical protein
MHLPPTTRRTLTAIAAAAAVAATVAATATGAPGHPSGREHITLSSVANGPATPTIHAVAAGPIHGTGSATIISKNGGRHDHLTLHLPDGSVTIIAVENHTSVKVNPNACSATNDGHGPFAVTGGTGRYRHVRGHGTYQRHALLTGARSSTGACLGNTAPPASTSVQVTMTGPVTLPRH